MAFLIIAVRNLLQARRRTALLSTALALVSALFVVLLSLSEGLSDTIINSATTLMSGHINVAGFYKAKPSDAYPMITRVGEIREIVRATLPDVTLLIDRNRGWGKMISESSSQQTGMAGIDIHEESALVDRVRLAKESDYKEGGRDEVVGRIEDLAEPQTAMIFAAQAERLGVTVGDRITLSTESLGGRVNTADVRIVAVAQDIGLMSGWSLFVPKQVLRDLYQLNDDTSGAVMVYIEDMSRIEEAMSELRVALSAAGFTLMERQSTPFWRKFEVAGGEDWTGQKLDLTTWEDEIGMLKTTVSVLDSVSYFLVAILLVIIVVGIMNTMWIAVRERTGEIGTLRAIGMGRRQVLTLFMTEAFLLGLFATTAGALAGALVAFGIDAAGIEITIDAVRAVLMSDTLDLSVRFGQIARAIGLFTFFTMAAALWPAMRASRLQPITAIHRVG